MIATTPKIAFDSKIDVYIFSGSSGRKSDRR